MNPLMKLPWFGPFLGACLYLTGMNDAFLHRLGNWWLGFGRWGQTAAVLAGLALVFYFTVGALNRRRSAYRAALRAADLTRPAAPPSP